MQFIGESNRYPTVHEADLDRIGLVLNGRMPINAAGVGRADIGAVASWNRFWLDHRSSAEAFSGSVYGFKVYGQHIDVLGLGLQNLRYDEQAPESGWLMDATWRHWLRFSPDSTYRRLELSLRGARYVAEEAVNSYRAVVPGIAVMWRIGAKPGLGTVDLGARGSAEWRIYDQGPPGNADERQVIYGLRANADFWICANATLGPYAALGRRRATIETDDYDRAQYGLRLAATW